MMTRTAAIAHAAEHIEPGDHLCGVYDRSEELLAMIVPFVKIGIQRGEQCLCVLQDNVAKDVQAALSRAGVDVAAALSSQALVIADRDDAYLSGGVFDPDAVFRYWSDSVASARASGLGACRFIGEMGWALGNPPPLEVLLKYEARLNPFLRSEQSLALCQYDRRIFSPAHIRAVLQTHPLVVYGELVCPNPFYVPAEELYHPDEQVEVDRLLRNILAHERAKEELRSAREELRRLAQRMVTLQETERREIARELHDELGQLLTAVKLILERSVKVTPEAAKEAIGEAQSLLSEMLERMRELTLRLRPTILDDRGLIPSLRWYVDRYRKQTGLHVYFQADGNVTQRFGWDIETTAYRIVQEALTNVTRHARVRHATVRVRADEHLLHIEVEDAGRGFDPDVVTGAGIVGMKERVAGVGGAMTIDTSGAGTRVTVTIPLDDLP